jgi:hypothetical protein
MIQTIYINIFNFISFNAIWALAIFKGNTALPLIIVLIAIHFVIVQERIIELKVVISGALLGYTIDCFLTLLGFFSFEKVPGITPLWLVFLWLGFCTTLQHSLRFFYEKPVLAVLFGGIFGALTYLLAAHLEAVELAFNQLTSFFILAIIWAILFPALIWINGFYRRAK